MAPLIERFTTDSSELSRFYDIEVSPTRIERLTAFNERWRARLVALDFDQLNAGERIDHVLLQAHVHAEARELEILGERLAASEALLSFAPTIIALEEARWSLADVDPAEAARTLDALADEVEALTKRVEAAADGEREREGAGEGEGEAEDVPEPTDDPADASEADADPDAGPDADPDADPDATDVADPLPVTDVEALRLAGQVRGLRRTLDTWARHYETFAPAFGWWTEKPLVRVRDALDAYREKLHEDIAGQKGEDDDPLVGDPIGRDALLADLQHEFIPYTPEQLLTLGEQQFAWCEEQMRVASRELGFGDRWMDALEHVKGLHVDPGEQDALVAQQAREAIAFLDERELVTIPELCRETWRVRMLSRESQRTLPFAAYGGQEMLVAYPTDDMDHDAKLQAMRGNNIHFSRLVTPHELVPGHHLQGHMAQRFATQRRPFSTPFLGEGWALYWEMREWDLGWARGPENRIGMLFWRMHRAARIIVSLGFHLERMSPDEMIDFLVDRVGHERDNATAEVRRYVGPYYGPLYQCAYMIGGLQLAALHEELVVNGELSEREFHDAVLRQNSIPVELIRAALRGDLIERDHVASWHFAGEVVPSGG
ncbi:MAG: hypothetical protein DHS20C15_32040 [Planctomycetota bacterium]|nr:MAG: hypothetical protein DHS20C15_32040 [Planctomycetota bacterium]